MSACGKRGAADGWHEHNIPFRLEQYIFYDIRFNAEIGTLEQNVEIFRSICSDLDLNHTGQGGRLEIENRNLLWEKDVPGNWSIRGPSRS